MRTKPNKNFSSLILSENIEKAEAVIKRWDLEEGSMNYCRIDSLFAGSDRTEAHEFLNSMTELQATMKSILKEDPSSEVLVRAQSLMKIATKRLEKEFRRILSSNVDAESVSNALSSARSSTSEFEDENQNFSEIAMADLKSIADAMISIGYGKECVTIYKAIRKSFVEESLYRLGVEKLSSSQIQKMDWESLEPKIKTWINAAKIAVTSLFHSERILCDLVFSVSRTVPESCFTDIIIEGATTLLALPENVTKYKKLSIENLFRILDLYEAVSELWPEIEFIFSYQSLSCLKSQAIDSLAKLGEATRTMLGDFEAAIQKDASKSPVPGGGIHPLTRYVMNYVIVLSDYSGTLSDIFTDSPHSVQFQTYFSSPVADSHLNSITSSRIAWLVLVLLCRLDVKAELYDDVALSYLFLANNLNYVVSKVRDSNLELLLGDEWLSNHEKRVKLYASNYERIGWSKVVSSLPEIDPTAENIPREVVSEWLYNFCTAFEETYRKQISWVVPEPKLRNEIRVSLAKRIGPGYRVVYEKFSSMFRREMEVEYFVGYTPEDLGNYLSDLFYGTRALGGGAASFSSSSSSPTSSH